MPFCKLLSGKTKNISYLVKFLTFGIFFLAIGVKSALADCTTSVTVNGLTGNSGTCVNTISSGTPGGTGCTFHFTWSVSSSIDNTPSPSTKVVYNSNWYPLANETGTSGNSSGGSGDLQVAGSGLAPTPPVGQTYLGTWSPKLYDSGTQVLGCQPISFTVTTIQLPDASCAPLNTSCSQSTLCCNNGVCTNGVCQNNPVPPPPPPPPPQPGTDCGLQGQGCGPSFNPSNCCSGLICNGGNGNGSCVTPPAPPPFPPPQNVSATWLTTCSGGQPAIKLTWKGANVDGSPATFTVMKAVPGNNPTPIATFNRTGVYVDKNIVAGNQYSYMVTAQNSQNPTSVAATWSNANPPPTEDNANAPWSDAITAKSNCAPLAASCTVSPVNAQLNQTVSWSAVATGGDGNYQYFWAGDPPLGGKTGQTVNISYNNSGPKSGTVTVVSGPDSVTQVCSNSLQLNTPAGKPPWIQTSNGDVHTNGNISVASPTFTPPSSTQTITRTINQDYSGSPKLLALVPDW